jgi:hypothetical protein
LFLFTSETFLALQGPFFSALFLFRVSLPPQDICTIFKIFQKLGAAARDSSCFVSVCVVSCWLLDDSIETVWFKARHPYPHTHRPRHTDTRTLTNRHRGTQSKAHRQKQTQTQAQAQTGTGTGAGTDTDIDTGAGTYTQTH